MLSEVARGLRDRVEASLRRGALHQTQDWFLRRLHKKYGVDRLLYYEVFDDPRPGIAREKQLKGWTRAKKIALIEQRNPHWEDLARDWYEDLLRRWEKWQQSLKAAASRG